MRIIIEIDSGDVVATPTAFVSQKAPGIFTATAALGATNAGPEPTGMMRSPMETEERAEKKVWEPATLAKEKALDAGSAPEDILGLTTAEAPTEALRKASSFTEAIDAGKPPRSLLEKVQGEIKND